MILFIARWIGDQTDRQSIGTGINRNGRGTDLSLMGSVSDWIIHLTLRRVARLRGQILAILERSFVSTAIRPLFAPIALYLPPPICPPLKRKGFQI